MGRNQGRTLTVVVPPGFFGVDRNIPQLRTHGGTAPTVGAMILGVNYNRIGLVITNTDVVSLKVGEKEKVLAGKGHVILVGNSLSLSTPTEIWAAGVGADATFTTLEEYFT